MDTPAYLPTSRRIVFFAALILALIACVVRPARASSTPNKISMESAVKTVSGLPEVKAWAKHLGDSTGGKVRATITITPQLPVIIERKSYWSVNCYENHPESHLVRWQTFLVRLDGRKIMVEDIVNGENIILQKWRAQQRVQ